MSIKALFEGLKDALSGQPEPDTRQDSPQDAQADDQDLGFLAPLVESIILEFRNVAEQRLGPHRVLDPQAVCQVRRIVMRPLTTEAHQALAHVVQHFNAEGIADFLRRRALREVPLAAFFDFDRFEGIEPLAAPEPAQADREATVRRQMLIEVIREIGLDGDAEMFFTRIDYDFPRRGESSDQAGHSGEIGEWVLADAGTERRLDVERRPRTAPIRIGRSASCEIALVATDKTLASAHHGNLWFEGETWWYQDAGARNGSRVESDGAVRQVRSDDRRPSDPIAIARGATIVFCAEGTGSPETHASLRWVGELSPVPRTPLAGRERVETPSTPLSVGHDSTKIGTFFARLSGLSSQTTPVSSLPATVGKANDQVVRVADAHTSVSRKHIRILSASAQGVELEILGKNGLTRGSDHVPQGEFLVLPWDEPVRLGFPVEEEPVCSLVFSRSSHESTGRER